MATKHVGAGEIKPNQKLSNRFFGKKCKTPIFWVKLHFLIEYFFDKALNIHTLERMCVNALE